MFDCRTKKWPYEQSHPSIFIMLLTTYYVWILTYWEFCTTREVSDFQSRSFTNPNPSIVEGVELPNQLVKNIQLTKE